MKGLKILSLAILVSLTLPVFSQQLPIFSLYRENSFVLNPAIAGSEDHGIATISYRDQWTGNVEGAPRTFNASYRSPIFKTNIGVGGHIMNDQTGPTSFTGFTASFSYHISFEKINPFFFLRFLRNSKIALGLSASMYQYRLNTSDLRLDQPNDNSVNEVNSGAILPNAGVGIYYYYDKFYLGFGAPNVIPLTASFGDLQVASIDRDIHYYVNVGGKIPIGDVYVPILTIAPAFWFKSVKGAPWQMDVYSRFIFKEMVWAGLGYRTSNNVIFDVGVMIKDQLQIGYAFDQGFGNVGSNIGGSHELLFSYHMPSKKFRLRRYPKGKKR